MKPHNVVIHANCKWFTERAMLDRGHQIIMTNGCKALAPRGPFAWVKELNMSEIIGANNGRNP